MLRGVRLADHSPDGPQTPKQALQEASAPSGGLALQPGVAGLAPQHAVARLLAVSLRPPGTPVVVVELQDAVGKVLLLFLAWRLVVAGGVAFAATTSSSSPAAASRLHHAAGVYGEDVAEDALGGREVHLRGAGRFDIQAAEGRRVGEGRVEAGQGRRRGSGFVNECHEEALRSSEESWTGGSLDRIREEKNKGVKNRSLSQCD